MTFLMVVTSLAASGAGDKMPSKTPPVPVVIGESIAAVRLGMPLADVQGLGFKLSPEGVDRADGHGWVSGPLLFIVDEKEKVFTVSLDLRKSNGAKVGKSVIPAAASLDAIAKLLPGCTLSNGSGGRALACTNAAGRVTNFYDSFMGNDLWVIMP